MRKLFWWLWTRLRRWWLYRGATPPYWDRPSENSCPTCYWEAGENYLSDDFIGSSDKHYGYEGTMYWTEQWRCPRCGTEFEINTSN